MIQVKTRVDGMASVLACVALCACALAGTRAFGQAAAAPGLTAGERALVAGSRAAIIGTGLSAAFFDRHFRVARVIDRPGDRRVVWLMSVGGYEATVNDSVGYYTEGGRRVDTHSVAATLSETSDITRTLTRARAERLMRRCIGRYDDAQVEYRAHGPQARAALLFTASRLVPPPPESPAARARREKAERETAQSQVPDDPQRDPLRKKKGGPSPVLLLGAVDLVTGECTVGHGQAGSPKPSP